MGIPAPSFTPTTMPAFASLSMLGSWTVPDASVNPVAPCGGGQTSWLPMGSTRVGCGHALGDRYGHQRRGGGDQQRRRAKTLVMRARQFQPVLLRWACAVRQVGESVGARPAAREVLGPAVPLRGLHRLPAARLRALVDGFVAGLAAAAPSPGVQGLAQAAGCKSSSTASAATAGPFSAARSAAIELARCRSLVLATCSRAR